MKTLGKTLVAAGVVAAVSLPFALRRPSEAKPQAVSRPPAAEKRVIATSAKMDPPLTPLTPLTPELTAAQQHTVDEWLRRSHDWPSLASQEAFSRIAH